MTMAKGEKKRPSVRQIGDGDNRERDDGGRPKGKGDTVRKGCIKEGTWRQGHLGLGANGDQNTCKRKRIRQKAVGQRQSNGAC